MNNQRLKQIVFSLSIVLSLFASSISASCLCRETAENHCQSPLSHEMNAENETVSTHHELPDEHHHDAVSTGDFSVNISSDDCCCVQNAPKTFVKSETVKIERQAINYQPNAPPNASFAPVKAIEAIDFAKPFYLSDSFYNLKSPRAPPRS